MIRSECAVAADLPAMLVDKPTAARMLCCCPNTIDNLRRRGDLRAVRLSDNPKAGVRFRVADLEALVAARLEPCVNRDAPSSAPSGNAAEFSNN